MFKPKDKRIFTILSKNICSSLPMLFLQFMVISYIMNLGWMVIMCLGVIPIIFYISIQSICDTEIYNKDAQDLDKYCFRLTQFGKLQSG